MQNISYSSLRRLLTLLILFFIMGCASKPVKIGLPPNHPANPEAQEAEFITPQNPFQMDITVMKEAPEKDSAMKHKSHKESGKQHMDHKMGTDKKDRTESESKMKPERTEGQHQHQEHSQ